MSYSNGDYSIGSLAKETGCKVPTIRYYEKVGLMPEPFRTSGNQRRYDRRHLQRLRFIRHSRDLGFTQDDVRELLTLGRDPEQPCEQADAIARHHLENVEIRMTQLAALKDELMRMVRQCEGGTIADCRIIEILSDHDLCLHEHTDSPVPN